MFGSSAMQNNSLPIMPTLPVLGNNISFVKPDNSNSILDYNHVRYVISGSSGIYHALKSHDVKRDAEVLIPAYHCPAMVEPVISLGATPVFYSITRNIEIDIDSISDLISEKTTAILVPHFFGVRSDIRKLREKCQLPKSICIIEDCAHAFFMSKRNPLDHGDYIIGSLTKFFPTHDGGVLASNIHRLTQPDSLSLKQELKAAYNSIHDAVRFGRFKFIAWLFSLMTYMRARDLQHEDSDDHQNSEQINQYDEAYHKEINLSASKTCKYIVSHANFSQIITKRKQNYQYILQELKNEKNIDLSLNNTNEDFIPYMVVVRLLSPSKHHPRLISKRLPIWRWEHIYSSSCKISEEYSQSIVQVPCHQQLTDAELVSMVASIKECLREN